MRPAIVTAIVLIAVQILDCHDGVPSSRLNFFDIDLLRFATENKEGNVMISPASIKSTLALLLEGADGTTATEIKSALRVSPERDDFRDEMSSFVDALQANVTNVYLRSANALFLSKKLRLKKQYETTVRRIYHTEIDQLDFSNPKSSVDAINGWVYRNTLGLIPTIVEQAQIPPSTEMMMTNALFFKASWKYSFNVRSTHRDCFYKKGVCTNVAMMDLQADLMYAFVDDLRAHALELPYQGERYSMILLVPQDRDADDALIRDLPYIGLPQILDLMDVNDVVLTLPKFDIEYNEDMAGALRKMRITSLFSQSANLSGIYEHGDYPHLNSIFHSVHMKVDEVGTVAAAATASLVVPLINNVVQLRVDRPFLFFIRDNKYGLILFEGRVDEPSAFQAKDKPRLASQPVPIQPFSSQSAQNHVASGRPILYPDISSKSSFGLSDSSQIKFNQDDSYQSTSHHSSQSEPITTLSPIPISTEVEIEEKKTSGISGFFKKISSYF